MPGDYTRRTFDPVKDRIGVFQQQGRVVVDADFNELVDTLDRRFRVTTLDTLGKAVVPRETLEGFKIVLGAGGVLTIGPGRAYVDGILVDNHGGGASAFDARLEERRGTEPIPYTAQPYVKPAPANPPTSGTYLAFLDVWHRDRTWVEEPDMLDPALNGVDTGTRRQTVWQVRVMAVPAGTTCATPDSSIAAWAAATVPASSRLTTTAVAVPAADDPCEIPPSGGYRGPENRLYRVEVHHGSDGGGTPTFKWSRDNGSVASPVLAITAGQRLRVARTGRDKVLRFRRDDWVEITDDVRELAGQPGEMAQILLVDEARDTIELTAPLTGPFDATDASRATRLRRWDQRTLLDPSRTPLPSTGPLKGVVPITSGANVVLEDGVQIQFNVDPAGGGYRPGEHWVFAARTASASVEELAAAPPLAPHHHYARLAVVTPATGVVDDCRTLWPPEPVTVEGGDCECTACVSVESHASGELTIQGGVDQVALTGGTVCLGPGLYRLDEPVQIRTNGVRVRGKGLATVVTSPFEGPAFLVESAQATTIEDLAIIGPRFEEGLTDGGLKAFLAAPSGGTTAIWLHNTAQSTVQRCVIAMDRQGDHEEAAITLTRIAEQPTIRDNVVAGVVGIGGVGFGLPVGSLDETRLLLSNARIIDNFLPVGLRGIAFAGPVRFWHANQVESNVVFDAQEVCIALAGQADPDTVTAIRANVVWAARVGILTSLSGSVIDANTVMGPAKRERSAAVEPDAEIGGYRSVRHSPGGYTTVGQKGSLEFPDPVVVVRDDRDRPAAFAVAVPPVAIILVATGEDKTLDHCRIVANSVVDMEALGIVASGDFTDLAITDNLVDGALDAGIAVVGRGSASTADNAVRRIRGGERAMAIGITARTLERIAVRDSTVEEIETDGAEIWRGIDVWDCQSTVVDGNSVARVGESESVSGAAAVAVSGRFEHIDVNDNSLQRSTGWEGVPGGLWHGVLIDGNKPKQIGDPAGGDGDKQQSLLTGLPVVAIRGNLVQGSGYGPVVQVTTPGSMTFSDNRTLFRPYKEGLPAVWGQCTTSVVSGNYVETAPESPAIDIDAHPSLCTVLGNVTNGLIGVRGGLLAPWDQLNVIAP